MLQLVLNVTVNQCVEMTIKTGSLSAPRTVVASLFQMAGTGKLKAKLPYPVQLCSA